MFFHPTFRLRPAAILSFFPAMPPKQKLPGPEELQKRFKKPDFQFLYFTGEEEFRMRRAASVWETELKTKNPTLKLKKLFGSELDWGTLANHLSGLSLFGDLYLFWIFEADRLRPTVRDALTGLLEKYAGPHFLLFWGEKADGRLKFTQLFLEKNLLFEFKTFSSPQQIAGWLAGYASERGLTLPPESGQMLLEKLGDDLSLLAAELDKLALAYAQLPPKEELEKEITARRHFAPWDLTGALAKKEVGLALSILKGLRLDGTSPGTIFYQLSEHYTKLLAFVLSGDYSNRTFQEWGFYGYLHPSLAAQVRLFTKERILSAIEEIASAERQTRFERISPDLILETLTIRLCNPELS